MADTVAIIPIRRSFGGITAQVTVHEMMRDDTTITEHPVENGANISDHMYSRPSEIEMEVGWDGTQGNPADNYATILRLKELRLPFDIITPKRYYQNMVLAGIAVPNDFRIEYSLRALLRFRQINLVSTQSTVVAPQQGAQADPAATSKSVDQGTQSLKPGSAVNTQMSSWTSVVG